MNQLPKQSANIEFKLCPPSLSKSSFTRSNSSIGTQKGFLGPALCNLLNFLFMLPMALACSPFGGVAISYVLPVLWMTSFT